MQLAPATLPKRWFVYWVDGTWTEVIVHPTTDTITVRSPYRRWPQTSELATEPRRYADAWNWGATATGTTEDLRPRLKSNTSKQQEALQYLADPENWLGNPHDISATLHGHFTPFELARRALGHDDQA